jgi:hypothetical protein
MRRDYHFTKDNLDTLKEEWAAVRGVIADDKLMKELPAEVATGLEMGRDSQAAPKYSRGLSGTEIFIENAVRMGAMEIKANMDDDLDSDDDEVRFDLVKTDFWLKLEREGKL